MDINKMFFNIIGWCYRMRNWFSYSKIGTNFQKWNFNFRNCNASDSLSEDETKNKYRKVTSDDMPGHIIASREDNNETGENKKWQRYVTRPHSHAPHAGTCTIAQLYRSQSWALQVFLYFFNNKKRFFEFVIKLIWLGVGFLNRTGAEIGY